MSDIFITYARPDRARAQALAESLEKQGWSVWWDPKIPPGRSFDEVIEQALDSAKCVIVLWSKSSVTSDWVKTEAAEGKRRGILVPVLIDDVKIPLEFRRIQAAWLVDWHGELPYPEFERVESAVSRILGSPPSFDRREHAEPKEHVRTDVQRRSDHIRASRGIKLPTGKIKSARAETLLNTGGQRQLTYGVVQRKSKRRIQKGLVWMAIPLASCVLIIVLFQKSWRKKPGVTETKMADTRQGEQISMRSMGTERDLASQMLVTYKVDIYYDQDFALDIAVAKQIRTILEEHSTVKEVILAPRPLGFLKSVTVIPPIVYEIRYDPVKEQEVALALLKTLTNVAPSLKLETKAVGTPTPSTLSIFLFSRASHERANEVDK